MTRSTITGFGALAVAVALTAGCAEDFESFNVVSKLRVLAIQAEPPELLPGESTELSALVYEPDGDDISYSWSWCPLATGASTGYECAVSEDDIEQLAESVFPGAGDLFPGFDLGHEPTATMAHSIDPMILQGFCDAILSSGAPSFVTLPDCEEELVVTVRLEVSGGGEMVTAVKEVALKMSDEAVVNSNPVIGDAEATGGGSSGAVEMPQGEATELYGDTTYDLFVAVPQESSEPYVPAPTDEVPDPEETSEAMFMSWFVTGGSTDFKRTTFLPGEIGLDELGSNSWKTPKADESAGAATLFLVLQDERGGVAWTERQIDVVER